MIYLKPDDYITKNFQYREFVVSKTNNDVVGRLWETVGGYNENIFFLAHFALQPIRDKLNNPLIITSGYRDALYNQFIGGSANSLHTQGLAADVITGCKADLFKAYAFAKDSLRHACSEIILYTDEHNSPIFLHIGLTLHGRKQIIKKVV